MSSHHRYSGDLPQGGLEVPCQLHFTGTPNEVEKVMLYFCQKTCSEMVPTEVPIPPDIDSAEKTCSSTSKMEEVVTSLTSLEVPVAPGIAGVSKTLNSKSSKDCVELFESKEDTRKLIGIVSGSNNIWIEKEGKSLNLADKVILEQGEELTDKHINMAQHLIKVQFPLIGGLQLTLLQQKLSNISKGSCTTITIQAIHHKKRMHWITTMT